MFTYMRLFSRLSACSGVSVTVPVMGAARLAKGMATWPVAPVQMGFNGAFVYLKAVYNRGL